MPQLVKLLTVLITVLFYGHFVTCDKETESFYNKALIIL